jgi:hypothetical protein
MPRGDETPHDNIVTIFSCEKPYRPLTVRDSLNPSRSVKAGPDQTVYSVQAFGRKIIPYLSMVPMVLLKAFLLRPILGIPA